MTDQSKRKCFAAVSILCATLYVSPIVPAQAQNDASNLQLPAGTVVDVLPPMTVRAAGEVQLWVQLVDSPLAVALGQNAKKQGSKLDGGQQRTYLQQLRQKQDSLMTQISSLG